MFPFNFGSVLWELWDPTPSEAPLQLFSPKCQSNHMLLVSEQLPVGHGALAQPSFCCSCFLFLFLVLFHGWGRSPSRRARFQKVGAILSR